MTATIRKVAIDVQAIDSHFMVTVDGEVSTPKEAKAIVLFSHAGGSSLTSPHSRYIADILHSAGLGTLLFDYFTHSETIDSRISHMRFDTSLLAERLIDITQWLAHQPDIAHLPVSYFDLNTNGAALLAATKIKNISSIVSCEGWLTIVGEPILKQIDVPTMVIIGEADTAARKMDIQAYRKLHCKKEFHIIPGVAHIFDDGKHRDSTREIAHLAIDWYAKHLPKPVTANTLTQVGNAG